jgi:hypothetical protein
MVLAVVVPSTKRKAGLPATRAAQAIGIAAFPPNPAECEAGKAKATKPCVCAWLKTQRGLQ